MSTQFEPGSAPQGFLPLSAPASQGNEWNYVKECLDSGWVSSAGAFVDRFEREIAEYAGTKHAVATVNGTSALHIALLVAGVRPEEEVILPSLTFIAPANAVRYAGAWPVFQDVDPDYWQLDPARVADFIENGCEWKSGSLVNRYTGRRVRAILPVDILGHPCDYDPLVELCEKYSLSLIEDATESLGATYRGRMAGALGQIGCFSFNGNKLITTGGGGMIVTDNEAMAERARYLTTQAKDDPVEYVHNEIGYNYRLTNIQAAIGCAQLERIDAHIASKRATATKYDALLDGAPGVAPMREADWACSTYWLYTARFDEAEFGMDRRKILDALNRSNIQARPLWQPMHLSRAHANAYSGDCHVAGAIWQQALSLPSSVGILDKDIQKVAHVVRRAAASN